MSNLLYYTMEAFHTESNVCIGRVFYSPLNIVMDRVLILSEAYGEKVKFNISVEDERYKLEED